MANRLSNEKRKLILNMLCEGSSLRSVSRTVGVKRDTVSRLIFAFGRAARNFMDETMRSLTLAQRVDET